MKMYDEYVCNTHDAVIEATNNLDMAKLVPLKIDDGGVIKDVDKFKGIYNVTQGKFCAAVASFYNLIQHKEYFDGFAEAMDRLNLKYKMTIKQTGDRAFADIEFEGRNLKFDNLNEEFMTGFRLANSYNKTLGIYVIPRFTRLACLNGMILTRSETTLNLRHTSKMIMDIQGFAEKKLNEIINRSDDLQSWVSQCMNDSIEWQVCCRMLEKMFIHLKHREKILEKLGIGVIELTDEKTKKKSISYVWNDESKKREKFTRWMVYNSITEYITFGEQITPHIENVLHYKAEKLLITPFANMPLAEARI